MNSKIIIFLLINDKGFYYLMFNVSFVMKGTPMVFQIYWKANEKEKRERTIFVYERGKKFKKIEEKIFGINENEMKEFCILHFAFMCYYFVN